MPLYLKKEIYMSEDQQFQLPIGMEQFEEMAKQVIEKSGLPDNDSVRFALATAVIHFPQEKPELSIEYFARVLRRGAANQVAAQVFQDLKLKQQAAIEAAKAAATPSTEGVSNEQQQKAAD
jgi:hypothetical protein